MEKNKIKKSLAVFATTLIVVIVGVASFAYFGTFNVNLVNNVAVNINSSSPGNATFTSNATQLNLQVPAANMSSTSSNNTVAAAENTAALTVSLTSGSDEIETTCTFDIYYEYTGSNYYGVSPNTKTSGVAKEITMTVNAPSGTSNFSTETNFDYNITWSKSDDGNPMKTLVSNATIISEGTKVTNMFAFELKFYNLTAHQVNMENQTLNGYIYAKKTKCENIS